MRSQRGEIATILTLGTLLVIGVSSLVSSLLLNQQKQTTSTKAASNKACGDDPEGAPAGFTWKADCSDAGKCITKATCPTNPDRNVNKDPDQTRWCYGFADPKGGANDQSDWRCMLLVYKGQSTQPTAGAPSPGGGGGGGGDFSTKSCVYSQNGKCYEGKCIDTSKDCTTNVNCGFVRDASGKELPTCQLGQSGPGTGGATPTVTPAPSWTPVPGNTTDGAKCRYSQVDSDGKTRCYEGNIKGANCEWIAGVSTGRRISCQGSYSSTMPTVDLNGNPVSGGGGQPNPTTPAGQPTLPPTPTATTVPNPQPSGDGMVGYRAAGTIKVNGFNKGIKVKLDIGDGKKWFNSDANTGVMDLGENGIFGVDTYIKQSEVASVKNCSLYVWQNGKELAREYKNNCTTEGSNVFNFEVQAQTTGDINIDGKVVNSGSGKFKDLQVKLFIYNASTNNWKELSKSSIQDDGSYNIQGRFSINEFKGLEQLCRLSVNTYDGDLRVGGTAQDFTCPLQKQTISVPANYNDPREYDATKPFNLTVKASMDIGSISVLQNTLYKKLLELGLIATPELCTIGINGTSAQVTISNAQTFNLNLAENYKDETRRIQGGDKNQILTDKPSFWVVASVICGNNIKYQNLVFTTELAPLLDPQQSDPNKRIWLYGPQELHYYIKLEQLNNLKKT